MLSCISNLRKALPPMAALIALAFASNASGNPAQFSFEAVVTGLDHVQHPGTGADPTLDNIGGVEVGGSVVAALTIGEAPLTDADPSPYRDEFRTVVGISTDGPLVADLSAVVTMGAETFQTGPGAGFERSSMDLAILDSEDGDSVVIQVYQEFPGGSATTITIALLDPTGTAFPGSGNLTGSYADTLELLRNLNLEDFVRREGSFLHFDEIGSAQRQSASFAAVDPVQFSFSATVTELTHVLDPRNNPNPTLHNIGGIEVGGSLNAAFTIGQSTVADADPSEYLDTFSTVVGPNHNGAPVADLNGSVTLGTATYQAGLGGGGNRSSMDLTITNSDDGDGVELEIYQELPGGQATTISISLRDPSGTVFPGSGNLSGSFFEAVALLNDLNVADFAEVEGSFVHFPDLQNTQQIQTASFGIARLLDSTTSGGTSVTVTIDGFDPNDNALVFDVAVQPTNGVVTGTGPTFFYTPNDNYSGTDTFLVLVNDGTGSVSAINVSVVVTVPPNAVPVAIAQSIATPRETSVAFTLSGIDADGDTLTYNFVDGPANGGLSGTPPNLVYTPDANFSGSDSFAFTVNDGQDSSENAAVTIMVDGTVNLLSAVLPASRSVQVGTSATAFATLINAGTAMATGCSLQLPDTLAAEFSYQMSDPSTNELVGEANQLVDIAAGASQSFVLRITPDEEILTTDVALAFRCANATDAASVVGLNTLLLSATVTAVPDLIALVATTTNNGVMELGDGSGFFTAATINVGATGTVSVSADTGSATMPMTFSLCQTDPVTSVCINPTVPSADPVIVDIAEGDSPTFAVFATATDAIALDPANNRVFLRLSDDTGVVRGATSVAVENAQ